MSGSVIIAGVLSAVSGDVNSILGESPNTHEHMNIHPAVIVINQLIKRSGDHTKALIGQLIIFNQILGELRQDIREQVSLSSDQ